MSEKTARNPRKGWRVFRVCFRWTRILILLLVLAAVCSLAWFSEVGLPDFLKRPMVESLEKRGVDLSFSRLRWRWLRGFVADDVIMGSAASPGDIPRLTLREVALEVDHSQLRHLRLKVDGLNLRGGRLVFPVTGTNRPGGSLTLSNIEATLLLRPGDEWELDNFSAACKGLRVTLSGDIRNASRLKDWPLFRHQGTGPAESFQERIRRITDIADQVTIEDSSQLGVILHGDALNPESFEAFLTLKTPGVETPWCQVTGGDMFLHLTPPPSGDGPSQLEWQLGAQGVDTEFARVDNLHANLHALGDDHLTNLVRARLELSTAKVTTSWAVVDNAHLSGNWAHSLTNPMPSEGVVKVLFTNIVTRWANAGNAFLTASLQTPAVSTPPNPGRGFWNVLSPYALGLQAEVHDLTAGDFQSAKVVFNGGWKAPLLQVTNLYTEMYQGHVHAVASLDVDTRRGEVTGESDFDALRASPLLSPSAKLWIDRQKFSCARPPQIQVSGGMTFPDWNRRHPDWRAEALPTVTAAGFFQWGGGSCRGIAFDSLASHVSYTNGLWALPDLALSRPEGALRLALGFQDQTLDFHLKMDSTVDVMALRPALDEKGRNVFDKFRVDYPPHLSGEVWGRWGEPARTGFKGRLAATNLTYKTEMVTLLEGDLEYTNKFLLLTRGRAERPGEFGTADAVGFDFNSMTGHLTNGYGVLDPMFVGRLIGVQTAKSLEPYHFLSPPKVRANGEIPLSEDISVSDLRFEIDGGRFEWWKFHLPRLSGTARWRGDELMLDNMSAGFYGGTLVGRAHFDFDTEEGTDFSFDVNATNSSLALLMADVSTVTNQLEGSFTGHLQVTHANTANPLSWFGGGHVELTNGLIWQIPIFGILTPVLNVISPGLGESRVGGGTADFVITNSVIRTENLVVRSPSLRLLYKGTVDFNFQVEAEVEAEVGRDTPLVGPLVSMFFTPVGKLFKTRVTGTLRDPKREPVLWLTRVISPLLHPWRIFSVFSAKPADNPEDSNAAKLPAPPPPSGDK